MNEYFFLIASLDRKKERIRDTSYMMRGVAFLLVFTVSFCSLSQPDTMKVAWYILFPMIWILFFIDVYLVKQNKKLEHRIYEMKKEELKNKKKLAKILSESLTDTVLDQKITEPSQKISIPLLYYITITAIAMTAMFILLNLC